MKKLFIKFSMMLFVLGMSTNTAWAFDQLMEQLNNEVYFAQMTATPSQTGSGKVYITGKTETFPADFDWDACAESSTVSRGIGAVVEGMDMVQVPFIMYCKANDGWYFKGWSYTQGGTDLEPLSREPGDEAIYDSHIGVLVNPSKQNGTENAKSYTIYATFDKIYVSNYSISGTNTVAKNGNITQTITFNLVGNDLNVNDFNAPSFVSTTGSGTWSSADGDDLVLSDVTINNPSKTATIDVKYIAPDEEDAQSTATLRFESKSGSRLDVVLSARTTSSSDVEAFLYNGNTKIGEGWTINDILNSDLSAYKNPILRLNKAHNGTIDIAKKITLDLNGYTLGGLTISTGADAVLAYSSFGGKISGNVNVNGGKLTLNGGSIEGAISISGGAELVQNGAAVTTVNNAGSLTTLDGTFSGTVTSGGTLLVKGGSFTGAPAIVTSGNATIQKGTIESATYGVESSGTTTIEKVVAIKGTTKALNITAGTTTLKCGRFESPDALVTGSGTLAFESAYFKSNSGLETYQGKQVWRVTVGTEYREGYNYFAGDGEQALTAGLSVCRIGNTSYSSLEDAFAYANNTNEDVVIIMENDYTLPAGYYTLPANATLLVPMKENQDAGSEVVKRNIAGENDYIKPSKYRKLTLANGVNIDVHGTIEVSGSQLSTNETYTGAPFGPYGQIHMNGGSKMVLQNGSELRAWGFVTFDGNAEIDARRGSMVRELFQLGDWKDFYFSGRGLMANADSKLGEEIFPITQYYIQNIEAPVKYHPGAKLSTATCVYAYFPQGMLGDMPPMNMNVIMTANNIPIVGVTGDDAMFLMDANADAENTWVRKWYDTSKDQQVYEINSGAHIGKLVIPLVYALGQENAVLDMNSGAYNLPITNNFKLHLLSGEMAFTQATALLPGAEVEVDKEAIVYVYAGSEGVRGGQLYVYDAEDWGEYAMNAKARQVKYSPSFEGAPNLRDTVNLVDASINVHGTFDTQGGFVYTTEGGANIFSSVEDAGTFIFTEVPTEEQKTATIAQVSDVVRESGAATRNIANCNLAYLRNSDDWFNNGGSRYVETGDAEVGTSYCYLDIDGQGGRWTNLQQRGCFTYESGSGTYYIKPQEYVAVVVNDAVWDEENGEFTSLSGNDDHTFSDAAGAGRLFINLGNPNDASSCQWWEVEKKDNYYHCIHPDNDTYYYWDETEWKEVKFTITWKNWDGSTITTYSVPYGTQAEWLSTNPTREKNVDYTYDFTGWSPALGKVTSDVTYTATYEAKQIKYTITFEQDGGVEIERHLLARDEVPVCENTPTRTGYILQWSPNDPAPVTGNQTYTATWLPAPPETYTITFKNYDGTVLKKANGTDDAVYTVTADGTPIYDGTTPTKTVNEGKEYEYAFTGWKPTLAPATTNATYVAQFSEKAKTYTINFYNEDDEILKTENLAWGATPTPPAVSKTETGYTFTYVWKNTADATKSIESVKGAADYKPVFTRTANKYTVTLQSNLPGACTFTGAGIYDYNASVSIAATPTEGYEFIKWQERAGGANLGTQTITGDITLTAVLKETAKPTPANLNVGTETVNVAEATNYMDLTITSNGIDASGQLTGATNITLLGDANFVFKKDIKAGYWYSFAVPWRVDATSGVYLGSSSTPAVLGKDFEIIYYDGSIRAAQGPVDACWVYMKNLSTKKVLEPGRAYMIFIKHGSQSQIVFRKKVQEKLLTTSTSVNSYPETTGNDGKDANWNAIANPALYHAYLYAGSGAKGFYYKSEDDQFDWYNLDETKLVVGEPVYIQAPNAGTIIANNKSYAAAPRRERVEQATSFDVQITAAGTTKRADHISVQIDENKEENKYVIGKDLTKFGVSAKLAQMWINRYDVKLCFNTIAPEGDNTSFPMSIYAPKAGEYTIAIEREVATEDYALYLTYNGEAIWNLSDGAYTANLNKGTDANYGLRISVRKAPEVATGMDEAVVDSKEAAAYKVLINNQVFIIRGEKVYSIDGQLVK